MCLPDTVKGDADEEARSSNDDRGRADRLGSHESRSRLPAGLFRQEPPQRPAGCYAKLRGPVKRCDGALAGPHDRTDHQWDPGVDGYRGARRGVPRTPGPTVSPLSPWRETTSTAAK